MKNIQIIDSADNCTFSIFQFTDEQFALIFSAAGQDIAFAEELEASLDERQIRQAFDGVWDRPLSKTMAMGIHGTIFYGFEDKKGCFPATRRECDWDELSLNSAQRELNAQLRAAR